MHERPTTAVWTAALILAGILPAPTAWAKARIPVKLFGQTCELLGGTDERVLRTVDSISPAQLPHEPLGASEAEEDKKKPLIKGAFLSTADTAALVTPVKAALDRLSKTTDLPVRFERYLADARTNLEAIVAFHDGLTQAEHTGKPDALWAAIRSHVPQKARAKFEKKIRAGFKNGRIPQALAIEYQEIVPALPEDEFHRALSASGMEYSCSYEEDAGENGKSEE